MSLNDFRLLVTGSRAWPDTDEGRGIIHDRLARVEAEHDYRVVLVSGHARGADRMCEALARAFGWDVEEHPADFSTGPHAGLERNARMVELGADLVIAFWFNRSPGTYDCINRALDAGLMVEVITEGGGQLNLLRSSDV